ncbi:hypothetical protein ACWEPN_09815 [Nonomuraea wenchangensis]
MADNVTFASAPDAPVPMRLSVFAGADICELAKLRLLPDAVRPVFEDDVWDMAGLADAPHQMSGAEKRLNFTPISNPRWRRVAKEYVLAGLAPDHEHVAILPFAVRSRKGPRTAYPQIMHLTQWFAWLTAQGVTELSAVTQDHCDAYLAEARLSKPIEGEPQRALALKTVAAKVATIQALALYGELFQTEGYRPDFVPWKGKTSRQVAGVRWNPVNATPPVPEEHFRRLLAAALYLTEVIGPHVADLKTEVKDSIRRAEALPHWPALAEHDKIIAVLDGHRRRGEPLVRADHTMVARRLRRGWAPDDPLLHLQFGPLTWPIGYSAPTGPLIQRLRPELERAVAEVGLEEQFARKAPLVPHARHWPGSDPELITWTEPMSSLRARQMATVVMTAALVVTAAISGMRNSELREIVPGSRREPVDIPGGGRRYRLASKVIKGQRFGGKPDEWVVLAEVDRAIALAERLTWNGEGEPIFGHFAFHSRYAGLRAFVNGPLGQRLGLEHIPDGPVTPRMLRRTLALELGRRPGGVLAAKVALKHVSVATSEGYLARPGGSQALFMAEVHKEEEAHKIELTAQIYRDYHEKGIMPAGPGARHLIDTFAHVDAALKEQAPGEPNVLDNERRLENLLRKTAKTLHIGAANYCWFRDPAKALCLRLAGTPDAKKPLAGMCDSARCPQATHHPCHRPVWQDRADTLEAFQANARFPAGEKRRMRPELDRTLVVLGQIDAACGAGCDAGQAVQEAMA